jgi:hypothetical protein
LDLNPQELQELQEQLLLVYKFINQNKMFKKFFFEGIEFKEPFKDETGLISRLMEMDDAEDILETSVLELEELIKGEKPEISFKDIFRATEWNVLYQKYGMKDLNDVEKLDLRNLLKLY